MKIFKFLKKLNNTELGKGNTHETYIYVPQDLNIDEIFPKENEKITFIDKETKTTYELRYTKGREKRIVGLGKFYKDNNICVGDEIVLEKQIHENSKEFYYISVKKYENIIVAQPFKYGFEIFNLEGINDTNFKNINNLKIEKIGEEKKREDSINIIDIYNITLDDSNLSQEIKNKKELFILELDFIRKKAFKKKFSAYKKIVCEGDNLDE